MSASPEEVREAFRRLSRKYHPDRNPEAKDKFEKINVGISRLNQHMRFCTMQRKSFSMIELG